MRAKFGQNADISLNDSRMMNQSMSDSVVETNLGLQSLIKQITPSWA